MKHENAYKAAVTAQARAEAQLDKLRKQHEQATDRHQILRLKLDIEKAEQTLLERIGEVRVAHAAYWRARAMEIRPQLLELARSARQYDLMMRAAGDGTVEPWLQAVRGELAAPGVTLDVEDVPEHPQLSDELDPHPNAFASNAATQAKIRREQAAARTLQPVQGL